MLIVYLVNQDNTIETLANAEISNSQITKETNTTTVNQVDQVEGISILSEPIQLSEAEFLISNRPMKLKLIMTKGEHITNAEIGPYGSDYYQGNLIGEVYDAQDKLVSSTDIGKYFSESVIFKDKFKLYFDDYNGDGFVDFTVGQYVSSNYNTFNIFTVKSQGEISVLPVENHPDGIMCSKFDGDYSTKLTKTQNNEIIVFIYDMRNGVLIENKYEWKQDKFIESIKTKNMKLTLKDGSIINSNDLIESLDKDTDETIKYVYNNLPNNIKIRNIYEGQFSNIENSQLLVIFNCAPGPHVGGLDFSVAALYDRKTLNLVSQKSFMSDECQFDVVKDDKNGTYLIFSGTTTYQGHSACELQLFELSKNWEQLLPQEGGIYAGGQYKVELMPNGVVSVLEPEFSNIDVIGWKEKCYLKWDEETSKLIDFIPTTFFYTKGSKYYDTESVSPDGRYAIVSHEWGIDEDSYILIYDIAQNRLINRYDILAKDFGYSWSPDSKKVCVTRAARIWIDTCIIDIKENSLVSLKDNNLVSFEKFQALGTKFDYTLNENRPDPCYQSCEWAPDSKRLLMFYQWYDSDGNKQSGNFIYSLDKKAISKITQNKPAMVDNLEPSKPKGFKW